jgi:hypothetical protein
VRRPVERRREGPLWTADQGDCFFSKPPRATGGVIICIVALSVSLEALIVSLVVMVVYQQIENYILQPTIIGKAAKVSGFTVLARVLVFGALS